MKTSRPVSPPTLHTPSRSHLSLPLLISSPLLEGILGETRWWCAIVHDRTTTTTTATASSAPAVGTLAIFVVVVVVVIVTMAATTAVVVKSTAHFTLCGTHGDILCGAIA